MLKKGNKFPRVKKLALGPAVHVYCHRPSSSARVLQKALKGEGFRAYRLYGVRNPRSLVIPVINWGCSELHIKRPNKLFNDPVRVGVATSKLQSLKLMDGEDVPVVRVTTDSSIAREWIKGGHKVLLRKDGLSAGRGIHIWDPAVKSAHPFDFYARVFPKTHEFRVHVVGGQVVDLVQKKAANDKVDVNRLIRTHENGWIYAHDDIVLQDQKDLDTLGDIAKRAIKAVGLDFGAVDILATVKENAPRRLSKAVVCEINTAPGLENTRTIKGYAEGLARLVK